MKLLSSIKYSLLSLFLIIFTVPLAFSQQQETAEETGLTPKFGIKVGANLANLYVDNVQDENIKLGLNIGFYGKIPLTRGLSIQPELLFSSKGAKLTYNNVLQGQGEYRFNLNYVEMPLLLVINLVPNLNLHLGGYTAFLTSSNVKDVNKDGTVNGVTNLKTDDFNRFDYGLVAGLGVDIQNMTLGMRYNYGLKEVGKSGSLSGDVTKNSKNSVFSLYVGFAF